LLACDWAVSLAGFTQIFPKDYKKALAATQAKEKAACESKQLPQNMSEGEPRSVQRSTTMDMEDLGKPHSAEKPINKCGFHEYSCKAMSYRTPGDRALDWDEVYAVPPNKSEQWHNWMRTQTARCMDCGTPTCHSPNQGGGGCPLGNRIPTWNQLVYEGEWKRALERLLDTNNFPEFTGTTCPAPCEEACVLGINEDPVAIKSIELAIIEHGFTKGWIQPQPPQQRTGRRVVIIGSGPAGLACAQQLNRAGHLVTVLERANRGGGLLMYGIPNMKLDKTSKVMRRMKLLEKEGIDFKYNTEVGRDVALGDLCKQNAAVVLATGATKWREMRNIEGQHLRNIVQAMDFLCEVQKDICEADTAHAAGGSGTGKNPYEVRGRRVIVIGGGDTAADCVATSLRLGAQSVLQFSRRDEAPTERPKHTPWPCWADTYRVDYAHAEGMAVHGRDPREYMVLTKAFKPSAHDPECVGAVVASQLAKTGREMEGVVEYPAELVLLAMGFTGPDDAVDPQGILRRDQHSNFLAPYGEYMCDGSPWNTLFACGDCRRGASLVVTAIAEGRDCAARIDAFLMGGETVLPRTAPLAANPSFFQLPKRGEEQTNIVKRHQRRRQQLQSKGVSEAFERGLLVEPKLDEPEAEMDNAGSASGSRPHTFGTSAPAAVATPQQNTAAAAPPQAAPAAPVPPLFAAALGGLAVVNLVLVGLLVRSRR